MRATNRATSGSGAGMMQQERRPLSSRTLALKVSLDDESAATAVTVEKKTF